MLISRMAAAAAEMKMNRMRRAWVQLLVGPRMKRTEGQYSLVSIGLQRMDCLRTKNFKYNRLEDYKNIR